VGQVTISARDEDGEPITGVVLSLSRERYRHNNSTGPDGSFTFVSLFPGAYLVRPVLKEYTFEPLAITVDVEEGGAHAEQFTAKRVAFSCFGVVQSLNGAPEAGVLVSAVATDAPMEETVRVLCHPPHPLLWFTLTCGTCGWCMCLLGACVVVTSGNRRVGQVPFARTEAWCELRSVSA